MNMPTGRLLSVCELNRRIEIVIDRWSCEKFYRKNSVGDMRSVIEKAGLGWGRNPDSELLTTETTYRIDLGI